MNFNYKNTIYLSNLPTDQKKEIDLEFGKEIMLGFLVENEELNVSVLDSQEMMTFLSQNGAMFAADNGSIVLLRGAVDSMDPSVINNPNWWTQARKDYWLGEIDAYLAFRASL